MRGEGDGRKGGGVEFRSNDDVFVAHSRDTSSSEGKKSEFLRHWCCGGWVGEWVGKRERGREKESLNTCVLVLVLVCVCKTHTREVIVYEQGIWGESRHMHAELREK